MAKYKVHVIRTCPFSARVLLTANLVNLDFELIVHTGYATLNTPEFLAMNPRAQCPVLETPDGGSLYESGAIIRYLARLHPDYKLYGDNLFDSAKIDILITKSNRFDVIVSRLFQFQINKKGRAPNEEEYQGKKKELYEKLTQLNEFLGERTFQHGNRLSIADISLAPHLITPFTWYVTPEDRAQFKNVVRYFNHITGQDFWVKTFGKFRYCEEEFPRMTPEQYQACLAAEEAKKQKAEE